MPTYTSSLPASLLDSLSATATELNVPKNKIIDLPKQGFW